MSTFFAGLAAFWACAAVALPAGQTGPYALRYKFRAGTVTRYRVTIDVRTAGSTGLKVLGTSEFRVLKVNPDGSAKMVSTQSSTLSGLMGARGSRMTATYTVTALGQMRGARVAGAGKSAQMMGVLLDPSALSLMLVHLPSRRVKPGDTWTSSSAGPFKGARPVAIRSRFLKVERTPAASYAQLRQSYVLPLDQVLDTGADRMRLTGRIDMGAAIRFDLSAGQVEDSTTTGTGSVQTRGSGGKAPAETTDLTFTTRLERMK